MVRRLPIRMVPLRFARKPDGSKARFFRPEDGVCQLLIETADVVAVYSGDTFTDCFENAKMMEILDRAIDDADFYDGVPEG